MTDCRLSEGETQADVAFRFFLCFFFSLAQLSWMWMVLLLLLPLLLTLPVHICNPPLYTHIQRFGCVGKTEMNQQKTQAKP